MSALRSTLLWLAWLAIAVSAPVALAEEHKTLNWPSRIIQLKAESAEAKPPVVSTLSLHSSGLLASAGDDHIVRVWDLNKGTLVQRLEAHTDWVRSIAYCPKANILATAGNDKKIIFWNALTADKDKDFVEHPQAVAIIAFSADGKFLAATGFEDKVRVYDVTLGKLVMEFDGTCRDMRALAFSPNHKYLAAGGRNGTVRVWSLADEKVVLEDTEHSQRIRSVEFSPDGTLLASCGEDRQVVVRNVSTGDAPVKLPRRPCKVLSMAFYGNKQLATGGSDNLIRLWDLENQSEIGRLAGHTGSVAALVFGDKTLISAGFDTTIRIWKMEDNVAEHPAGLPRIGKLPAETETK
jgi:WD40 repeat protein